MKHPAPAAYFFLLGSDEFNTKILLPNFFCSTFFEERFRLCCPDALDSKKFLTALCPQILTQNFCRLNIEYERCDRPNQRNATGVNSKMWALRALLTVSIPHTTPRGQNIFRPLRRPNTSLRLPKKNHGFSKKFR